MLPKGSLARFVVRNDNHMNNLRKRRNSDMRGRKYTYDGRLNYTHASGISYVQPPQDWDDGYQPALLHRVHHVEDRQVHRDDHTAHDHTQEHDHDRLEQ